MNSVKKHDLKSEIYKNYFLSFYNFQFFPADKNHMLFKIIIICAHFKSDFLSQLVSKQLINVF